MDGWLIFPFMRMDIHTWVPASRSRADCSYSINFWCFEKPSIFFTAAASFYLLAMQRALTSPYPHQCFPSLPPPSSSFFPYLFWHKLTVWLRLDSNLWTYCLSFLCADLAFSLHTHPNMHEMVSQNVHFPNDQRYWAPLRMLLTTCLSVWVYMFKPFAHYLRYCSYEKTPWPR